MLLANFALVILQPPSQIVVIGWARVGVLVASLEDSQRREVPGAFFALSLHKPCATGTEESILHSQASPRSAYNLNDWGTPAAFRILDLVFAFAYVGWEPRVLQWRPEKAFRLPARAETISPAAWNVIAFGCPGEVVIKLSAQHSVDGPVLDAGPSRRHIP